MNTLKREQPTLAEIATSSYANAAAAAVAAQVQVARHMPSAEDLPSGETWVRCAVAWAEVAKLAAEASYLAGKASEPAQVESTKRVERLEKRK
ncbi:MAG: hypothetical protein UY96_C0013G0003 [Parcubacteria group bacterium GW2011_GWB1_56_8]|nr:MAG: hypothetical protein UY96_C0013G0003 [Parcubacteria group bacterium GW2011_GWB1_56_8]